VNYTREFRQFIGGQYLYSGVRITAGFIIPIMILHHYGMLSAMMALPLGALCVGLTDNPGPLHHRRNGLIASILINCVVALITVWSRQIPWLISTEIVAFGLFFSLIGMYGTRINSIGLIALLVFIFNIDSHLPAQPYQNALLFTAGGVWYFLLSLFLHTLRPYKPIQQLLGECLIDIADYLKTKAAFYEEGRKDFSYLNNNLIQQQIDIHRKQDELREMLFKTRSVVKESTTKGRVLMAIFLDSIDLFERIMTSQQDYQELHKEFDDADILPYYRRIIAALADELHDIGLNVQDGTVAKPVTDIAALLEETQQHYTEVRNKMISPNTLEGFIKLRQILYSIEDLSERLDTLRNYTRYDRKTARAANADVDVQLFVERRELNPQMLIDNLSFSSAHFRHAVRVTLAMLMGYIISLLFPLGHGYWILLTIVTIIKPAYSITRQRNLHRLGGTIFGALLSFVILYFIHDSTVLFIFMLLAMILSYSLIKLNYFVSSTCITIYVVLSFHFLNPSGLSIALKDRVIDTAIGSCIAYIFSWILPTWEHEQVSDLVKKALQANQRYFKIVASFFTEQKADVNTFKLARKEAFVALANLSDNFQRMITEPKHKQVHIEEYHQFVATSHLLTSHIASLSYYAQREDMIWHPDDFKPVIEQVNQYFDMALNVYMNKDTEIKDMKLLFPENTKLQELLKQRKHELQHQVESSLSFRKSLTDLKVITDQFRLISTIVGNEIKVLYAIRH